MERNNATGGQKRRTSGTVSSCAVPTKKQKHTSQLPPGALQSHGTGPLNAESSTGLLPVGHTGSIKTKAVFLTAAVVERLPTEDPTFISTGSTWKVPKQQTNENSSIPGQTIKTETHFAHPNNTPTLRDLGGPSTQYDEDHQDDQDEEQEENSLEPILVSEREKAQPVHETGDRECSQPSWSFSCLAALAIKNSPDKRLDLTEISDFIKYNFPFFRKYPDFCRGNVMTGLYRQHWFSNVLLDNKTYYMINNYWMNCINKTIRRKLQRNQNALAFPETIDALVAGTLGMRPTAVGVVDIAGSTPKIGYSIDGYSVTLHLDELINIDKLQNAKLDQEQGQADVPPEVAAVHGPTSAAATETGADELLNNTGLFLPKLGIVEKLPAVALHFNEYVEKVFELQQEKVESLKKQENYTAQLEDQKAKLEASEQKIDKLTKENDEWEVKYKAMLERALNAEKRLEKAVTAATESD